MVFYVHLCTLWQCDLRVVHAVLHVTKCLVCNWVSLYMYNALCSLQNLLASSQGIKRMAHVGVVL